MVKKIIDAELQRRREAHSFFIDPLGFGGGSHPRIRLGPPGLPVPSSLRRIFETRNIELRREFIEKEYGGYENFFRAFPDYHKVLEMTEEGTLHCFKPSADGRSFKMAVLEVNDSSHPSKHFLIPVPRKFKTVHAARAWTFGMTPEEFHPIAET